MINMYYKYKNNYPDTGKCSVSIAAVGHQTDIYLGVYNTDTDEVGGIRLNEQEQNDLIAGILERRGVIKVHAVKTWLQWTETLDRPFPISATGTEQSKIHPATKEEDI